MTGERVVDVAGGMAGVGAGVAVTVAIGRVVPAKGASVDKAIGD